MVVASAWKGRVAGKFISMKLDCFATENAATKDAELSTKPAFCPGRFSDKFTLPNRINIL
jgi:hypothetical protein